MITYVIYNLQLKILQYQLLIGSIFIVCYRLPLFAVLLAGVVLTDAFKTVSSDAIILS